MPLGSHPFCPFRTRDFRIGRDATTQWKGRKVGRRSPGLAQTAFNSHGPSFLPLSRIHQAFNGSGHTVIRTVLNYRVLALSLLGRKLFTYILFPSHPILENCHFPHLNRRQGLGNSGRIPLPKKA